jgi:hypothetical protein
MHYQGTAFGKRISKYPYLAITMTYKGTKTPVPVNRELTDEDVKKLQYIAGCSTDTGSTSDRKPQSGNNKPRFNRKKNKKRRGRKSRG